MRNSNYGNKQVGRICTVRRRVDEANLFGPQSKITMSSVRLACTRLRPEVYFDLRIPSTSNAAAFTYFLHIHEGDS